VASSCGSRKGPLISPATLEEATAVREVLGESARAAADAVRSAGAAAREGLAAAGERARAATAQLQQCVRPLFGDLSEFESAAAAASEQWVLGLDSEAEAEKEEGNRLYAARRFEDALAAYESARRRDPGRAQYASNAAAALAALGRRRDSLSAYCQAAALDARFERPHARLAAACGSAEALEEALSCAMACAAARPDASAARDLVEVMATCLRARAQSRHMFERGRYVEAEAAASEALERCELLRGAAGGGGLPTCPGAAVLLDCRAAARAALHRFGEALADAEAAAAMAPDDAELRRRRDDMVRALNRQAAFSQRVDNRGNVGAVQGAGGVSADLL